MLPWYITLLCFLQQICASSETNYECGAHGKFEYCIKKQPGCVVGCHCHPGYYFDTDTKICEPNLKLTQFRRLYNVEPTRAPVTNYDSVSFPTLTTLSPVDEKVDEIAKDADDLGDWLYNQFFKTIENQVINNTEGDLNTRRSGSEPQVKSNKRTHKRKKKSKKKKHIKKGLKNKLLRITEDDSLFDSSSSSDSDESEYTSSESSDSSDDHDHRKIVMINKKPTPPLPSFIFLPNVETPFYPPIGLPAPPIVPMYPMVPVPPMGIMYPGESPTTSLSTPSPSITSTSSTTSKSTDASHSTGAPPAETTPPSNEVSTIPATQSPETSDPSLDVGGRSGKYDEFMQRTPNKGMGPRNKFLQKMRNKMKNKNKHIRNFMRDAEELNPPFINMPVERSEMHPQEMEEMQKLEDVDFKYLSQLIHKIDLNKTEPKSLHNINPNYGDAISHLTRRINYPNRPINPYNWPKYENSIAQTYFQPPHKQRPVSKADDVNDSYFANLGKQIASLIRKFDSNSNRQIDIEIQPQSLPNALLTTNLMNENIVPQGRSYWERYVRSPLNTFLSYLRKNEPQPHTSEDLISIEDQVKLATAITRPFSLQELENMANVVEKAHFNEKKVRRTPIVKTANPNNQNKFNLLPQINKRIHLPITMTKASDELNVQKVQQNTMINVRRYNEMMKNSPSNIKQTRKHNITVPDGNRTRSVVNMNTLKRILNIQPHKTPLHHQVSRIVQRNVTNSKHLTAQQLMKYNLNPFLVRYKNIYNVNNNHNLNKYHVQRSFFPYSYPVFKPKTAQTSYFHHEFHHFDYFDK